MIRLFHRLTHAITHREEYVRGVSGAVYERCYLRHTGELVGVKVSKPGRRQNFQPVGGA
jgi:hypothetical protein